MFDALEIEKLCLGCMERSFGEEIPCPLCGWQLSGDVRSPHQLPIQTILSGKYLIGRVLGEGGFGITYLGWDLNLDMKVAVKEYYPAGFVTRETTTTTTVTPFSGDRREAFLLGLDKFVGEAKSLAKFYSFPGIVSVKDFFKENGTAYIVMEFINGVTLKQFLMKKGGRLPVQQVIELAKPLVKSLSKMHEAGIIHRDISPDNIMLTEDGDIKLLDFGAARDISTDGVKSLSVLLKPGYAPEEQYRTRGKQGPWTDVYAFCATLYKMITGETPPESMERMRDDPLVLPSSLGIAISGDVEAVLSKGLAVFQENRYQSMGEVYKALESEDSKTKPLQDAHSGEGANHQKKIIPSVKNSAAMRPLPEDRPALPLQGGTEAGTMQQAQKPKSLSGGKYASDFVMKPLPDAMEASVVKKAAPIQYFKPKEEKKSEKPNRFEGYVMKPLYEPGAEMPKDQKKAGKKFFGPR